jgi:Zn-dependent protease
MVRAEAAGTLLEPDLLAMLPVWYAVFLLSVTCHEAAHALVALRGGDRTAYLGGQVTLNPVPHVLREPIGTIVVPLLTFLQLGWMMGWASAPYDPLWEARHPRRAAAMAASGPLANLLLAGLAFAALKTGLGSGAFTIPADGISLDRLVSASSGTPALLEGVGRMLSVLLVLNLVLLVFNLFPLPPMDGASVAAGLVRPLRGAYASLRGSPLGSLAGLVASYWLFQLAFPPIRDWVLLSLYS